MSKGRIAVGAIAALLVIRARHNEERSEPTPAATARTATPTNRIVVVSPPETTTVSTPATASELATSFAAGAEATARITWAASAWSAKTRTA